MGVGLGNRTAKSRKLLTTWLCLRWHLILPVVLAGLGLVCCGRGAPEPAPATRPAAVDPRSGDGLRQATPALTRPYVVGNHAPATLDGIDTFPIIGPDDPAATAPADSPTAAPSSFPR